MARDAVLFTDENTDLYAALSKGLQHRSGGKEALFDQPFTDSRGVEITVQDVVKFLDDLGEGGRANFIASHTEYKQRHIEHKEWEKQDAIEKAEYKQEMDRWIS